jgi:phage shock protein A
MFIFAEYYREETARLVQQLGDSRVQVATLEAQVEFLANKVEEQETVDSLYIQRSGTRRADMDGNCCRACFVRHITSS